MSDDQAKDAGRLRAKGHANANLRRTLVDHGRNHTVDANGRQQRRERGENAEQQKGKTRARLRLRDEHIHRLHFEHQELRVETGERGPYSRRVLRGIASCS